MSDTINEHKVREIITRNVVNKLSDVGRELMEFRSNFQASAQGIIDNVSRVLNDVEEEVLRELREEVASLESSLRTKLEPEFRSLLEAEVRSKLESELQGQIESARQMGIAAEHQKLQQQLETLNGAIKEISLGGTQVEILTAYLDKAALFAPRVALFVVKSNNIVGWQARGFEGEANNDIVRSLVLSASGDEFFGRICESKASFHGATSSNPAVAEFVARFGPIVPDSVCAIPLVVREKTVAILYADSGLMPNLPLDHLSLDTLTTTVALSVELSSARTKLGIKPSSTSAAHVPTVAAAPAGPAQAPLKAPSAEAQAPQPVPQHHVEQADEPAPTPVSTEAAFHPEPVSQESPRETAGESASAVATAPDPPPVPSASVRPEELSESEQKLHNDAKRFARLLVSEIKLYNEQKVLEGRRDHNLYGLLRDDIDKSREMYDKRVAPDVASRIDYFYDELVRILGDNSAESLGKDCPGPVLAR
ncbi:MAG: hypothetical protein AB1898_14525 [Acidobacteriota bacterium]